MSCDRSALYPSNVIMNTEDNCSANAIAAMIASSCTPPATFQGTRSISVFETVNDRKRSASNCYSALDLSDDIGDEDGSDDCIHLGEKKKKAELRTSEGSREKFRNGQQTGTREENAVGKGSRSAAKTNCRLVSE